MIPGLRHVALVGGPCNGLTSLTNCRTVSANRQIYVQWNDEKSDLFFHLQSLVLPQLAAEDIQTLVEFTLMVSSDESPNPKIMAKVTKLAERPSYLNAINEAIRYDLV